MLAFVYTSNYQDKDEEVEEDEDRNDTGAIWFNVQVHVAARRLSVPALALLSTLKFTQRALPMLLTEKFAAAIKEIYTVSPDLNLSLQDSVIGMCKDDAAEMLSGKSQSFNHIRNVAKQVPLFAAQLEHHTRPRRGSARLCRKLARPRTACPVRCMKPIVLGIRFPHAAAVTRQSRQLLMGKFCGSVPIAEALRIAM